MQNSLSYKEEVIRYYDACWVERFKAGHNPKSLAMHMGYFDGTVTDNDEAKNNMNRFVAENLNLNVGPYPKAIVDAGCGIGSTCLFLASNYPGLNITGINISARQIAMAEEFISKRQLNQGSISFFCEDYSHTSLAEDSADAVYTVESLCHADAKQQFYQEAYRILKPGGLLLIIDYIDTLRDADTNTPAMRDTFQKGWAVNKYINKPAEGLATAGFGQVSINSIRAKVMPGIIKSYDTAVSKISSLNGSIPEIMRHHLDACIALKHLAQNEVIDYCMIKAFKPLNKGAAK